MRARRLLATTAAFVTAMYVGLGCTTKFHAPTGAPGGGGGPVLVFRTPDSVQAIFDNPTYGPCTSCHSGSGAPGGEDLSADSSYAVLVDRPAGTDACSGLMRVRRFNPDSSCLMRRLDGRAQPQMPLTGPPFLTAADTLIIYHWIKAGAPGTPIGPIAL